MRLVGISKAEHQAECDVEYIGDQEWEKGAADKYVAVAEIGD